EQGAGERWPAMAAVAGLSCPYQLGGATMMLWEALGAVRDLGRIQEIASVLIRYGFGDVAQRLGLVRVLERAGKVLHWQAAQELLELSPPARVRRAMEDLGPTFVKLGQVLATRVDLFSPEWIAEFSH